MYTGIPRFALLASLLLVACSRAPAPKPAPAESRAFSFASGGAHHLQGYGEWRVRLGPDGDFAIEHDVRGEVTDHGHRGLTDAEREELATAIAAARAVPVPAELRPGIPDEALMTFVYGEGEGARTVERWAGDVRDDGAHTELLLLLRRLIEEYAGVVPVF